jgi:hypothetical protein
MRRRVTSSSLSLEAIFRGCLLNLATGRCACTGPPDTWPDGVVSEERARSTYVLACPMMTDLYVPRRQGQIDRTGVYLSTRDTFVAAPEHSPVT